MHGQLQRSRHHETCVLYCVPFPSASHAVRLRPYQSKYIHKVVNGFWLAAHSMWMRATLLPLQIALGQNVK